MAPSFEDVLDGSFGQPTMAQDKSMPIAVVGMSFRGPKDATSVENLWKMITERREGWSKIPKQKWNNDAFYHPDNTRHGTINVEGGHFFEEDLARFDAPFFNMTNSEAAALDPQQRLLLEGAFEALENGGISLKDIMGSKASCFVGSFSGDYTDMLLRDPDCVPMYQCTNAGQSRAITANRVSYFFDLKGPSVTVDTACSGSLVALHLACQSLRSGDAKVAFAAGVNTVLSHEFMSTMSMMRFLSPDGRCYTFDERANGYARGEGVGFLILKPLEDAIKDNDTIRAIIRGSGSNSDGKTSGITLPSSTAQEQLIRDVYDAAGLNPLETEYVECHGTGTQAGDPQETGALARVFSVGRSADQPLRIGSIKTNVGHLEGASGIAGVIKAILMLENRTFLPNRNFRTLNPRIPLEEWKLKIQLDTESWDSVGPHRISVNSFGYGGSNAHVILEDAEGYLSARSLKGSFRKVRAFLPREQERIVNRRHDSVYANGQQDNGLPADLANGHAATNHSDEQINGKANGSAEREANGYTNGHANGHTNGHVSPAKSFRPRLFSLSSFDEASGKKQLESLKAYIQERLPECDDEFMNNLAFTLNERRTSFVWKLAVPASSPQSLIEALDQGGKHLRSVKKPTIAFVFTGQGAQWCGMGKELLGAFPVFDKSIDRIGAYLKSIGAPFDVRTEITRDPSGSLINLALYSQPMCSAVQIAMVDLLRSWGIKPASVTGHSSGEIAAAYTMGALSMEDAMAAAYYRGLVSHGMQQTGERKGAMMAVGMSQAEVQPYLASLKQGVAVVACVNSPTSMTISGDVAAIDELQAILDEKKVFARKLAVEVAYHSPHMEFVAPAYRALLGDLTPKTGKSADDAVSEGDVEFFSSVTGEKASASDLGPDYWVQNMLGQVKFADSLRLLCLDTTDPSARGKAKLRRKRTGAAVKVTVDILIEIGPHSALAGPIKQILKSDPKISLASPSYASALIRKNSAVTSALSLAGSLLTAGFPVDIAAINRPKGVGADYDPQVLVDLPPYSWNHSNTYWAEPRVSKVYRNRAYPRTDLLGVLDRNSSSLEPRWRNYLRASEIPWIKDHKIQSNVVFPASGYIVMALEAAFQVASTRYDVPVLGYNLRDMTIGAALIMTEEAPAEVMTSMRPHGRGSATPWYEFSICSVTEDNRWTEHSRGLISVQLATSSVNEVSGNGETDAEAAGTRKMFEKAEAECGQDVDITAFYDHLTTIGLEYGETFANMSRARSGHGTCIADIIISDTASKMPMNFQYPLPIHPSTLDAIFHPIFVALSAEKLIENPAVPTSIDSIFISHLLGTEPGHHLRAYASTGWENYEHLVADIAVMDGESNSERLPGVSIKGLNCTVLARDKEESSEPDTQRIAYHLQWEADADLLSAEQATKIVAGNIGGDDELQAISLYEEAAYHYITEALNALTPAEFSSLDPHIQKQYSSLSELAHKFRVQREQEGGKLLEKIDPDAKAQLLEKVKASGPEGVMLGAVGEQLVDIFRKKVNPWSVITGENRLESYWSKTPRFVRSYAAAARYLSLLGHKNPHLSILEVDAGNGSATIPILEALGGAHGETASFKKYTFTDLDNSWFETVSEALDPWKGLLKFKELNIEVDFNEQGFDPNSFDVVVMAHGTHMLKSREAMLKNVRSLLKHNGRLIIIDSITESESMSKSLILGNLPSWWASESAHSITEAAWQETLVKAGFSGLALSVRDMAQSTGFEGSMMVSKVADDESKLSQPTVVVIAEEGDCGVNIQELGSLLNILGLHVEVASFADAKTEGKTCIVLSELQSSILEKPDTTTFESLKRVFIRSAGVLWVVRGGAIASKDPMANLVTGFARTARSETGDRAIVTLDLDAKHVASSEAAARTIFALFRDHFTLGHPVEDLDSEYAERDGVLMIPRVVESTKINAKIVSTLGTPVPIDQPLYQSGRPLHATIGTQGNLDTIHFLEAENPGDLPDDFIEIEVKACGLNKKDAHFANGQLPGPYSLGAECSGTIRAIGKNVHDFNIGDRVACYGSGTIASYYRDSASSFQKIPDDMSFELAAAVPIAYCTAYHAVYNLARVLRGESVLVHDAAEPCGQAIVEFCKLLGAQVFATVTSATQKHLLMAQMGLLEQHIFFNGDESFAKGLMRLTEGQGVDVIFNPLTGSTEAQRLSWNCLAPYGRFIELTGQDVAKTARLEMGNCTKDAMFAALDFAKLIKWKPKVASGLLSRVVDLFRAGVLSGPGPILRYEIPSIDEALQKLHGEQSLVGKVVLAGNSGTIVKAVPQDNSSQLLRPDASYLLVGGLGGIGRAAAMWMLDHGARNIIFANRSGRTKREAQETIQALEARGANVAVYSCDVSIMSQVSDMVAKVGEEMPAIRGVIQAAMVLRDGMIDNLSVDDYNAVVQPKVQGTWNLHNCLGRDMDFFVMLSSVSGVIGNASQSAYAAAGTFMDAFASYRNSLGLPAVTLDLGVITGIGYLSENKELAAAMEVQGFEGTNEEKLMALLKSAIVDPRRQDAALSQTITGLGTWKQGESLGNLDAPLFAKFRRLGLREAEEGDGSSEDTARAAIGAATTMDEAAAAVCAALVEKLAARLGTPVDNIVSTKTISEYGVDSLVAVEMRSWIAKEMESPIPILEILANQSLLQLSAKIAAKSKLVKAKAEDE